MANLKKCETIGFDTESKPSRKKRTSSHKKGPHLIQLSTLDVAYLFHVRDVPKSAEYSRFEQEMHLQLKRVLESHAIKKVGFGLFSDKQELKSKLNITVENVVDLSFVLRECGESNQLGAVTAMKRYFGLSFSKPSAISCSDWSTPIRYYTDQMIKYAANDAYVSLLVYNEWQSRLKVTDENRFIDNYCAETWRAAPGTEEIVASSKKPLSAVKLVGIEWLIEKM